MTPDVKRRFDRAVEGLMDAYMMDGEELSREDAEKMVMDYALTHDGYFDEIDEARQKGEYKTRKQYAEAQRAEFEGTVRERNAKKKKKAAKMSDRDLEYKNYDKPIRGEDVRGLRSINNAMRLSVNQFSREDLLKTRKWAYKYYQQMGVKSPFFRAWFGEWRAKDLNPVVIAEIPGTEYTSKSVATYSKSKKGTYNNQDTGWDIRVSHQGPGGSFWHGNNDMLSVIGLSGVDELIHNAVLLDSETHEIDHSGNPSPQQIQTDTHAFDHKLYALGENPAGEIGLYRITVEDVFQGKNNQNDMIFHNLRYIEKIADIGEESAEKTRSILQSGSYLRQHNGVEIL